MLETFVVYIGLPLILVFCGWLYRHNNTYNRTVISALAILLFAVVIGMRYDVGSDWVSYHYKFEHFKETDNKEIGWLFSTLHFLGLPYPSFFIVTAGLQIFFFWDSVKKYPTILASAVFFYFSTLQFFLSMNVVRQTLAWCIFLYSVRFIVNRNLLRYMMCMIFACLFHRSSLMLIVFYFMPRKYRGAPLAYACIYFAIFIIGTALQEQISAYASGIAILLGYDYYGENMEKLMETIKWGSENSLGIAKMLFLIMNLCVILNIKRIVAAFPRIPVGIFFILYFIGILIDCIVGGTILDRFTMYFLPFRIVMYAVLLVWLTRQNAVIPKLAAVVLAVVFIGFYIYSGILGNASGCTPFQFV